MELNNLAVLVPGLNSIQMFTEKHPWSRRRELIMKKDPSLRQIFLLATDWMILASGHHESPLMGWMFQHLHQKGALDSCCASLTVLSGA